MKILISGPIRPSEDAVLEVIQSMRRQFPDAVIFLSTWTANSLRVKESVDYFSELPEPQNKDIDNMVTERTRQQQALGLSDETPGCKYALYKMMCGVENVCKLASPYVQDSDIVMRLRTDSMFLFSPGYFPFSPNTYVARDRDGFDWFCLTTFSIMKHVWCFSSLQEYKQNVRDAWNPEDFIRRRVNVPIVDLDKTKCQSYILRQGGFKHYYD